MGLSKIASGYGVDKLLMDGTSAIKDLISGAAFTMTGVPTTAPLLGATAPVISAAGYTSCKIANATIGLLAGMDVTILIALNCPWAGNDGVAHYLFSAGGSNPNRFNIYKSSTNRLYVEMNTALASPVGAITALNWPADTDTFVIVTRSGANVNAYLNGANIISSTGNTVEAALYANACVGSTSAAATPVEGAILASIWGGVLV